MLVDLTVPPSQSAVAINCFGLETSVTSAHAWLHERTGGPIVPAHTEPLPGGCYRLVFHPRIANTAGMTHQQIAQACWNSFEPYVRKNPAPWLWMYKYWRYRPANPDRLYPFYSNFYRPFENMVAANKTNASDEAKL
jgi:lauroyl/myristoyl acyltransferase